ncbi:hypothetical protein F5Y05DRAFT_370978 [Hypoxylon sp. FL0543]|nr:hypothetical protein F5Y05DRAFT_370978 [Hypoxylon sp. FL0543]
MGLSHYLGTSRGRYLRYINFQSSLLFHSSNIVPCSHFPTRFQSSFFRCTQPRTSRRLFIVSLPSPQLPETNNHSPLISRHCDRASEVMGSQSSPTQKDRASLDGLPQETMVSIASYLTTPEYGTLRLVCRKIENLLFEPFAFEFFTKRQFMFSEFSLGALVGISESRLAPHLKYLIFTLERPYMFFLGQNLYHINNGTGIAHHYARGYEEYLSHQALVSSGQDFELIVRALRNLPKLETVGLRDYPCHGRYRDGGDCLWRTYGTLTYYRETGVPYMPSPLFESLKSEDITHICHIFRTILRAVGTAREPDAYPGLEVILRRHFLPDFALNIPRYLQPTISPVLEGLKVLVLSIAPPTFPGLVSDGQGGYLTHNGFLLAKFLSTMHSLEELRLNFGGSGYNAAEMVKWLANIPKSSDAVGSTQGVNNVEGRFAEMPPTPEFRHLKRLDIGMLTLDVSLLLDLYTRYKSSLRKISFHRVNLVSEWSGQVEDRVNLWAWFLRRVTQLGFNLSAITLSRLGQHRIDEFPLLFRRPGEAPAEASVKSMKWTGMDWERDSREFIQSMVVIPRDGGDPCVGDGEDSDVEMEGM